MEKAPESLEVVLQYFADFSPAQLQQLSALEQLYKEWNTQINVISRKDIDSLYEKHVLHSLAIAAAFGFTPGSAVIDIGTGGGFPGIPLAIFFPETRFHLVDSIGKKIKVVEAVKTSIGLTNITTQHGRAEEIKNKKFDVAVSRAVAPLKDLWTWTRPLLRKPARPTPITPIPVTSLPVTSLSVAPKSTSAPAAPHIAAADSSPSRSSATAPSSHGGPAFPSGLICLKGGDLAAEISDSGTRPKMMEIYDLFPLDYFKEKYLLQIPFA